MIRNIIIKKKAREMPRLFGKIPAGLDGEPQPLIEGDDWTAAENAADPLKARQGSEDVTWPRRVSCEARCGQERTRAALGFATPYVALLASTDHRGVPDDPVPVAGPVVGDDRHAAAR